MEEVPQHKTKDLDYYLRNDRTYTQAEKEEYKRLKQAENLQTQQDQQWQRGDWEYTWNANGSLKSVKLPDGEIVAFEYDALGRRTKKIFNNKIIRYLWDNNVLLHEWEYDKTEAPRRVVNKLGEVSFDKPEPVQNLITWVYETGSFVPCAKIIGNETFSIINDYIGRPIQAYDNNGNLVWSCDYNIYGNLRNLKGERNFIPFRQLGQYEDVETGLYYNRFRYYSPETGFYISKDPIGLAGGLTFYAYVHDVNSWVDVFGLWSIMDKIPSFKGWQRRHIIPKSLGGYNKTGYIHEVIKLSGVDVDKISQNIIHLPMFKGLDASRSLHNGGHSDYTKMVRELLDDIHVEGMQMNAGSDFYRNRVFDLINELREGLLSVKIKCKN